MKKIYGFLGVAALLMTAACSKDGDGGPQAPETNNGDLYMTMKVAQSSSVGSRTSTPDQGYEVGKDRENNISSLLVIFAKKAADQESYTVFTTAQPIAADIVGASKEYKASFSFDRQTLLTDIETNGAGSGEMTYYLFVVANPTQGIITSCTKGADVQQVFELTADNATYWTDNEFLMSNADVVEKTIKASDIPLGSHTTKADAYPLGTVEIQRAMSRFDLETSAAHTKFFGQGDNNNNGPTELAQSELVVEFDAVALINMAKKANLFKVMAENETALNGKTISFGDERKAAQKEWWVFSPDQENSYLQPLFTSLAGSKSTKFTGTQVAFADFFDTSKSANFTLISALKEAEEDNVFTHPTTQTPSSLGDYHIWRYCMENTNPDDAAYQKNANSTGIVLRAKLSGTKIPASGEEAIYAYNNVVLGTASELKTYATNPKGEGEDNVVYENVRIIYAAAVEAAKKAWKQSPDHTNTEWDGETNGSLSDLDTFLVEQKFTIYRPTMVGEDVQTPVYYCYYLYWNRHNDNDANTEMGIMEFATVRNNVYKIMINKVISLGHPGAPGDDPEDPDPDDPDEKDKFWLDIECKILDWEVRMNGLDL